MDKAGQGGGAVGGAVGGLHNTKNMGYK